MNCSAALRISLGFALFLGLILFNLQSLGEVSSSQNTDNSPIKIGMSTALSGPAELLGKQMKLGIEIYFNKINAKGGINGRKLELITLDDKYEPTLAGPNMRKLINQEKVLAVIGNVGTPTGIVTVPIANELHTLLFGAFSGAGIFRKNPPDRYIINFRGSYEKEMETMIKGLLSIGIKPDEMGFLAQNDSYGDSGYLGAMKALKASGYPNPEELPYGRYNRNTLNIMGGLGSILASANKPIKAFIMIGAYEPVAAFIKAAKKEFPNALFLNVSFVGSAALAQNLGKNESNIIVTEVVPSLNSNLAAVKEYRDDLKLYGQGAKADFGSLEGYLMAKVFVLALQKAASENKLTREGLIDSFETMKDVDLGLNISISYSKDDHEGLQMIWPMLLKNKEFIPLDWKQLKRE